MIGWSRAERRRPRPWGSGTLGRALLVLALGPVGCAETSLSSTAPAAGPGPRSAADDSDLWNLVPQSADAVADVDLGTLRSSAWSSALVTGGFAGDREESRRTFGYDVFADGERLLTVTAEVAGVPRQLTIVRGRFDPARVGAAALGSMPGGQATRWRDSPIWEGGGHAVALVTPRTLAQGDSDSVRGAIDAAWGIVPDGNAGPLGELRRSLGADRNPPAVLVAVLVTDALRGRAAGFVEVPAGMRSGAVRLDLSTDLSVELVALLGDANAARAAAAAFSQAIADAGRQRMLRLLGLGPILGGVALGAEGSRVHGHLTIAAERREALAAKLHFILQALLDARSRPSQ